MHVPLCTELAPASTQPDWFSQAVELQGEELQSELDEAGPGELFFEDVEPFDLPPDEEDLWLTAQHPWS